MKQVLAIARLTFWEGIRMRIVLVFVIVLVFIVLKLPFALKGDETLAGRLQTFLSYSLNALAVFMSLATAFFSCATLSNDVRNKTIHMVLTKPVARFKVLLGKWVGVNMLNLLIVAISGLVIYGFAAYIKTRPVAFDRDRLKIDDTVWTARLAAGPTPPDFIEIAKQVYARRLEDAQDAITSPEVAIAEIAKELREKWLNIAPGYERIFLFEGLSPPESDQTIYQVRFKARATPLPMDEHVLIIWSVLDPTTGARLDFKETRERNAEVHQFFVGTGIVKDGTAALAVGNPPPSQRYFSTLYFEGTDALQILYKAGSFEANFARALGIILFRLAFLSAVGVFFGTFVSFPVACFCVLTVFMLCLGMPWWLESIGANAQVLDKNTDPYAGLLGQVLSRFVIWAALIIFGFIIGSLGWAKPNVVILAIAAIAIALEAFNTATGFYSGGVIRAVLTFVMQYALPNFVDYDGTTQLIEGYRISSGLMIRSAAHTLIYGTFLLLLPGWLVFRSREIAEVIV